MNQPAKSQEPSMEEILASIRRIIADDDAKTSGSSARREPAIHPAPAPVVVPAPLPPATVMPPSPIEFLRDIPPATPLPVARGEEAADFLPSLDDNPEPEPASVFARRGAQQPEFLIADSEPAFDPEPMLEAEPDLAAQAPDETEMAAPDPLEEARQTLSEQIAMDTPLLSRSATAAVDTAFASLTQTVLNQNARTLDDVVKDMLRPMLKSWLDDNLPSLVERLVRAEIERVSRGR